MSLLNNVKIANKIAGSLLLLLALMIGLGLFAWQRLGNLNDATAEVAGSWMPGLAAIGQMNTAASDLQIATLQYVAADTEQDRASSQAEMDAQLKLFEDMLANYEPTIYLPEDRTLFNAVEAAWRDYVDMHDRVLSLLRGNQPADAEQLLRGDANAAFRDAATKLQALVDFNVRQGKDSATTAAAIYSQASTLIFVALGIALLAAAVLGVFMVTGIARPIVAMTAAMLRLARGDNSVDVPAVGRKDEVGQMADAVQVFKDNAIAMEKMRRDQAEAERQAAREKAAEMNALAHEFDQSVGAIVGIVSAAATELEAAAQTLTASSVEANAKAATVAAASNEASANVQTVAAATEELAASIREIGANVARSSEMTVRAATEAEQTSETVKTLVATTGKIGDVVQLISSIASQTNLLALNATIEAARAGEAGKGFAVVASEVKALANQTAKATEEIGAQIQAVQSVTEQTAEAIRGIGATIVSTREAASGIAAAVEEQDAATQEIARNVQQASAGTNEVTGAIGQVSQASAEAGSAASQVLSSAQELARSSADLKRQVDTFLARIRVAA